MANEKHRALPITEQQVEDVAALLSTLKGKANEAHSKGDAYMCSVYADLVKVVSPIVQRAHARMHRESNAQINKNARELRTGQKASSGT
jgi:hypothetical protein